LITYLENSIWVLQAHVIGRYLLGGGVTEENGGHLLLNTKEQV